MRVFMLGWEFPPHISGGLGTACYGMTKGLDEIGVEVCFVLPTAVPIDTSSHVKVRTPADIHPVGETAAIEETSQIFDHVELHKVDAVIQAYGTPNESDELIRKLIAKQMYEASAAAPNLGEQAAQHGQAVVDRQPRSQQHHDRDRPDPATSPRRKPLP